MFKGISFLFLLAFTMFSTKVYTEKNNNLKVLQDRIMDKINIHGTMSNNLINGEVNEWHFVNTEKDSSKLIKTPTLLIHGYAASSMAWHRTFSDLSSYIKDLYAIDLPGNGLSASPCLPKIARSEDVSYTLSKDKSSFKVKKLPKNPEEELKIISEYESYCVDRIEKWRIANNIKKFNLVGHSFGGYISFKYSIKYPKSVENLCLVSPLGVERSIHSLHNNLKSGEIYKFSSEDPTSQYYDRTFNIPSFLFKNQLNTLRWFGPVGGKLAKSFINSAYQMVPGTEYQDYLYNIFYDSKSFPKTTIQCFTNMFSKTLMAKDPIMDNLDKLKASKVMFMYGEMDWMNSEAGYQAAKILNDTGRYSRSDGSIQYEIVPEAGHNVFLHNPKPFTNTLLKFLM